MSNSFTLHPTAIVEPDVIIGDGTSVWHYVHIRRGAKIGQGCTIGKGVFIDQEVRLGSAVKVQNNASIYRGVEIEDGVFIGPHVCFTNDLYPRAVNPDLSPKSQLDWVLSRTVVAKGASIGANSTIVAGVTIGVWSLIAAGSVVTKSVPPYALVRGNPARIVGIVSPGGAVLARTYAAGTYPVPSSTDVVRILEEWCQ
jgi:UDP-2-acetamido-3-amino-2,3-dideoxy-glucuronate N-acetyltransferase